MPYGENVYQLALLREKKEKVLPICHFYLQLRIGYAYIWALSFSPDSLSSRDLPWRKRKQLPRQIPRIRAQCID
jgi:hypothetical protein